MNLQHTSASTIENSRPSRTWRIAPLCGAALVLATLAFGYWRDDERRQTDAVGARSRDAATAGASTSGAATAAGAIAPRSTVYLVETEEDAAFVRRFTAEINGSRARAGQPPVGDTVAVVSGLDANLDAAFSRPADVIVLNARSR